MNNIGINEMVRIIYEFTYFEKNLDHVQSQKGKLEVSLSESDSNERVILLYPVIDQFLRQWMGVNYQNSFINRHWRKMIEKYQFLAIHPYNSLKRDIYFS